MPTPPDQAAVDLRSPSWLQVRGGFAWIQAGLLCLLAGVVLSVVGIVLSVFILSSPEGRSRAAGTNGFPLEAILLIATGMPTLMGYALMTLGRASCTRVPKETGARGFALGAMIATGVTMTLVGLILLLNLQMALDGKAAPWQLGLGALAGWVVLIAWVSSEVFFLFFLARMCVMFGPGHQSLRRGILRYAVVLIVCLVSVLGLSLVISNRAGNRGSSGSWAGSSIILGVLWQILPLIAVEVARGVTMAFNVDLMDKARKAVQDWLEGNVS